MQEMVVQLIEEGHRPINSNYYGPYRKGVYYQPKGTFDPDSPMPRDHVQNVKFRRHPDDPDLHMWHPLEDVAIER